MRTVAAIAVLIAIGLTAASAGAAEPAGSPALYVATGDGYAVAFELEGGKVSVLGLDATVYCSLTEPGEYSEPACRLLPLADPDAGWVPRPGRDGRSRRCFRLQ
jgi:hypothetical protein